jgi:hypothetical protein
LRQNRLKHYLLLLTVCLQQRNIFDKIEIKSILG